MLLSAKHAREFVEASIKKKREEELEKIDEAVSEALEQDEFCCDIDGNISAYAKSALEELGYNVQYLGDQKEQFTRIEW